MHRYAFIFFSISFLVFNIDSFGQNQHTSCSSNRYITDFFPSVTSTKNILFGNNTTIQGNNTDLFMDIYEPSNDLASARPVVLLAFGGSFITGTREELEGLCSFFAQRGFVAATIDYRLYDGPILPLPGESTIIDQIMKSVSDMRAAIRFLKEDAANANIYKIDPNQIFIGGISAGAIIANHVAYIDSDDTLNTAINTAITNNGGIEGDSSANLQFNSSINGVINFSGAILDTDLIDSNDPPIFSAHDIDDTVVPYENGFLTFFGSNIINANGSNSIHAKANSEAIQNALITINSDSHVSYLNNISASNNVLNQCTIFFNDILCPTTLGNSHNSNRLNDINIYLNTTQTKLNISDINTHKLSFKIFSISGNLVYSSNSSIADENTLDFNYPSGVYIVKIFDEVDHLRRNIKLVKH